MQTKKINNGSSYHAMDVYADKIIKKNEMRDPVSGNPGYRHRSSAYVLYPIEHHHIRFLLSYAD